MSIKKRDVQDYKTSIGSGLQYIEDSKQRILPRKEFERKLRR